MNGAKKQILFVCTVILTLATAWWIIPMAIDIWGAGTTPIQAYRLGWFLGIVLGACWSALIWYWTGKD